VGDAAWPVRAAIALPLLTGAIRYARNGTAVAAQEVELRDLPGLGTVFYAFVPVVAVFLDAPLSVPAVTLTFLLCVASALFAVLMLAPVKYPKLSLFPGASPAVLILLAAMPLVGTKIIAAAALLIGSAYVIGGPFALRRVDPARSGDARGDR
jgi:phosphatidylserine synthase